MPKRRDESETAFDTLQELLRRDAERDGKPLPPKPAPEKMAVRVKAGKKGGKIGGKARAAALPAKKRKIIAKRAVRVRWNKQD